MKQQKKCRRCKRMKSLNDFYEHSQMADGHLNICKACKRVDSARYLRTKAGREVQRKANKKRQRIISARAVEWEKKNPEKHRASAMVRRAVRNGDMNKPKRCEDCNNKVPARLLHGHHEDYDSPLDVEWLCPSCHRKRHPNYKYDFLDNEVAI